MNQNRSENDLVYSYCN